MRAKVQFLLSMINTLLRCDGEVKPPCAAFCPDSAVMHEGDVVTPVTLTDELIV